MSEPPNEKADILLNIERINPTQMRLEGTLILRVPKRIVPQIRDTSGKHVFIPSRARYSGEAAPGTPQFQLLSLYAYKKFELKYAGGRQGHPTLMPVAQVPLRDLSNATSPITAPLRLPVVGASRTYPEDEYSLGSPGQMILRLPAGLEWNHSAELPIRGRAQLSLTTSGFRFLHSDQRDEDYTEELSDLTVVRASSIRWFVWSVAVAPSLILLVAAYQIIRARGNPSRAVPLELAAAVLAILPLRQVLVPSSIERLTQIDYLLSVELVAFIALAVIASLLPTQTGRAINLDPAGQQRSAPSLNPDGTGTSKI